MATSWQAEALTKILLNLDRLDSHKHDIGSERSTQTITKALCPIHQRGATYSDEIRWCGCVDRKRLEREDEDIFKYSPPSVKKYGDLQLLESFLGTGSPPDHKQQKTMFGKKTPEFPTVSSNLAKNNSNETPQLIGTELLDWQKQVILIPSFKRSRNLEFNTTAPSNKSRSTTWLRRRTCQQPAESGSMGRLGLESRFGSASNGDTTYTSKPRTSGGMATKVKNSSYSMTSTQKSLDIISRSGWTPTPLPRRRNTGRCKSDPIVLS